MTLDGNAQHLLTPFALRRHQFYLLSAISLAPATTNCATHSPGALHVPWTKEKLSLHIYTVRLKSCDTKTFSRCRHRLAPDVLCARPSVSPNQPACLALHSYGKRRASTFVDCAIPSRSRWPDSHFEQRTMSFTRRHRVIRLPRQTGAHVPFSRAPFHTICIP
jgi:hypothetical protein